MQTAFCLAIVGCCVAMGMPVAHLVAHASDLGHAAARAAEMLAIALLTSTVVRLVGGALVVDRFGGLVALLAFSVLQAAAMLLYALVDGMLALYAVSALFGIGYGGLTICYPVLVREHLPPSEAGRRLGVILLFGTLAMGLGGLAGGLHLRLDRKLRARIPGRCGVQRRQPDRRPRPHHPYADRLAARPYGQAQITLRGHPRENGPHGFDTITAYLPPCVSGNAESRVTLPVLRLTGRTKYLSMLPNRAGDQATAWSINQQNLRGTPRFAGVRSNPRSRIPTGEEEAGVCSAN